MQHLLPRFATIILQSTPPFAHSARPLGQPFHCTVHILNTPYCVCADSAHPRLYPLYRTLYPLYPPHLLTVPKKMLRFPKKLLCFFAFLREKHSNLRKKRNTFFGTVKRYGGGRCSGYSRHGAFVLRGRYSSCICRTGCDIWLTKKRALVLACTLNFNHFLLFGFSFHTLEMSGRHFKPISNTPTISKYLVQHYFAAKRIHCLANTIST